MQTRLSHKKISRRHFLKSFFLSLFALFLSPRLLPTAFSKQTSNRRINKGKKGKYDLVCAQGENPYDMTTAAIAAMGGMGRFVTKGDTVVIKPNMAFDRTPEYAAGTNPLVVAALVDLCFQAQAKRVKVFDRTANAAARCYESSGIKKAAEERGAKVYFVDDWNYVEARFDYKSSLEGWPIYLDAITCDTFINVPILKHHALTSLTLSMKNLMGVCGGNRGTLHLSIGKKLVDLTNFINPDLTVIDAFRVLTKHGPSGGNLEDVEDVKKLIVATDPTLADTYACQLVNKDPHSVPYIAEARKRNIGTKIEDARIFKVNSSA